MGPAASSPLVIRAICSRVAPYMCLMPPSVVEVLTTVGTLVGRAGPNPWWLWDLALCGGCGPAGWGRAGTHMATIMGQEVTGPQGWYWPAGTPALLNVSPNGFQTRMLLGRVFPVQDPQDGEPSVGLRHLTPWGGPLWLWYSSHLWVTNLGCESWLCSVSAPPVHLVVVPSLCL